MPETFIPYSTQTISQEDIDAVVEALQSGWLTGGPAVQQFEKEMAHYCGVGHGAAVSSGTAALHAAIRALQIAPGDEIIVPPLSFVATANAILYEGGIPVFCDVEAATLLIDPDSIEPLITPRTRAVICVDYAGQLCEYDKISVICKRHNLVLISDACHSLGAEHKGGKSGSLADLTAFSFHPVKQITTGEGGMVMTSNEEYFHHICSFRNHGMSVDPRKRQKLNQFQYEINELGWNYRLSDIQCALGRSQLKMLDRWTATRRTIAGVYDTCFAGHPRIRPLALKSLENHAYHLYVVRVPQRDRIFTEMRHKNIGVNVHYPPIHLHNYYQATLNTHQGLCPVAEEAYASILSIPLYPGLSAADQHYVATSLIDAVNQL